jgi:hypothetical protein
MDANEFENTAALLYSKHCCFLLMTLRLVPIGGQSISSEWVELGKLVPKVLVFDGQVFNGRCDSGY